MNLPKEKYKRALDLLTATTPRLQTTAPDTIDQEHQRWLKRNERKVIKLCIAIAEATGQREKVQELHGLLSVTNTAHSPDSASHQIAEESDTRESPTDTANNQPQQRLRPPRFELPLAPPGLIRRWSWDIEPDSQAEAHAHNAIAVPGGAWIDGTRGNMWPRDTFGSDGEGVFAMNLADLDLDDFALIFEFCPSKARNATDGSPNGIVFSCGPGYRWLVLKRHQNGQANLMLNLNDGITIPFEDNLLTPEEWHRIAIAVEEKQLVVCASSTTALK